MPRLAAVIAGARGVPEPAVRQEELPAVEPEVLAELVEHEPEVPVTLGPDLPTAAVEAGTAAASAGTAGEAGTAEAAGGEDGVAAGSNGDNLPLLVLHL